MFVGGPVATRAEVLGSADGAESPVFTGFQAQKKTSVDVFRGRGNLN